MFSFSGSSQLFAMIAIGIKISNNTSRIFIFTNTYLCLIEILNEMSWLNAESDNDIWQSPSSH